MSRMQNCDQGRSRRTFCVEAGLVGLGAAAYVRGARKARGPMGKLNMGIIGAGGRGGANTNGVRHENIYALCDVNEKALDGAKKKYKDAKVVYDWRKLVADEKIDAVVISTADHHHAVAAIAAMRAGKHVYCEKPLAHTVWEARQMQLEYGRKRDVISTQMGTQIHATDNYRRVVELVKGGAVGKVREAHVWCGRTIRPVGKAVLDKQEAPGWFHWEEWLGPAEGREYNQGYWKGGNLNWNRRWEFGNGVLGDMGSHLIDLPYWALDLEYPETVVSAGPAADAVACPPWQEVTWEHGGRKGNPYLSEAVKVKWYHGPEGMKRRSDALQKKVGGDTNLSKWFIGVAFVGDDGILVADYGKRLLSPKKKFEGYKAPKQSIAKSKGHYKEWTEACRSGEPTTCNFEYSGRLIEHNLLGNVAHRVGKKLVWDSKKFKVTNVKEANGYLTKRYRDGWGIGKSA